MATPSTVCRTSGGVVSTNAQIKVDCGFRPAMVHIINQTNNASLMWHGGMPQDSGLRQSGATSQFVTTSGVKTYEDSSGQGFTIEPGGPINPTGSQNLYWAAFRGDMSPGNG